jgi:iron transport multicopper oxidase
VDIHGRPRLTLAGNSADAFGCSSSAPIVTSNGTTSGSALVWIVWNPDSSGVGAELRAYDALPGVNGRLLQRFSAPVGQGSKFNPPGVFQNHLYVGTRDGHVIGFGLSPDTSGVDAPSPRASLGIARPNPSAGATTMDLALAQGGRATLTIFDLRGRRVRLLVDGDFAAGSQPVIWDGRDDRGAIVPPGLYLARLDAAGTRQTRRVMLVR